MLLIICALPRHAIIFALLPPPPPRHFRHAAIDDAHALRFCRARRFMPRRHDFAALCACAAAPLLAARCWRHFFTRRAAAIFTPPFFLHSFTSFDCRRHRFRCIYRHRRRRHIIFITRYFIIAAFAAPSLSDTPMSACRYFAIAVCRQAHAATPRRQRVTASMPARLRCRAMRVCRHERDCA